MHGCVDYPENIVLTKQDYIRYEDRFAALAGIVQSTLLTRHLLFVGFSLEDDNFQRIFDSVRKASRGDSHSPNLSDSVRNNLRHKKKSVYGTALLLKHAFRKVTLLI